LLTTDNKPHAITGAGLFTFRGDYETGNETEKDNGAGKRAKAI